MLLGLTHIHAVLILNLLVYCSAGFSWYDQSTVYFNESSNTSIQITSVLHNCDIRLRFKTAWTCVNTSALSSLLVYYYPFVSEVPHYRYSYDTSLTGICHWSNTITTAAGIDLTSGVYNGIVVADQYLYISDVDMCDAIESIIKPIIQECMQSRLDTLFTDEYIPKHGFYKYYWIPIASGSFVIFIWCLGLCNWTQCKRFTGTRLISLGTYLIRQIGVVHPDPIPDPIVVPAPKPVSVTEIIP